MIPTVSDLIVYALIQVLDKNITLAGLAEGGVTLGPHYTAASSTQ